MELTIGSLFSGYGGLDLAVQAVTGGKVVWHCEWDDAPSKILATHFPGVPNYRDVSLVDFTKVETVDILCGGFPCQDVSSAGRRAGLIYGTRSGLWAEFARAIDELRPKLVVIENVRGLMSADGEPWPVEVTDAHIIKEFYDRALLTTRRRLAKVKRRLARQGERDIEYEKRKAQEIDRLARSRKRALARFNNLRRRLVQRAIGTVLEDLADLGYDARWTPVRASDAGAPHQRFRIFIIAYPAGGGVDSELTLPTPTAVYPGGTAQQHLNRKPGRKVVTDLRMIAEEGLFESGDELPTLPTPRATRGGSNTETRELLLPTPNTMEHLPARSGAAYEKSLRRGDLNGSRRNQAGNLREAVIHDLLPTVVTTDAKGGRNSTARRRSEKPHHIGDTLTDVFLPTPTTSEGNGVGGHGTGSDDLRTVVTNELLPTPDAAAAVRGGSQNPANRRKGGHQVSLQDVIEFDLGLASGRVFLLFSMEAVVIGLLGSLIGVGVGMGIGSVVSNVLSRTVFSDLAGLQLVAFDLTSVLTVIVIVVSIAFVAGAFPAIKAARKDPIESLRYE